jgi:hypothetical protein
MAAFEDRITAFLFRRRLGEELRRAIMAGDRALAAECVAKGLPVNYAPRRSRHPEPPLWHAVIHDRPGIVADLIAAGADLDQVARDETPLLCAASRRPDIGVQLVEAGADPEFSPDGVYKPLHLAAARGHVDLVKALIKAGARSDSCNIHEESALWWAARVGNAAGLTALLETEAAASPEARRAALDKCLRLVAECGVSAGNMVVFHVPHGGSGSAEIAQLLLAHGADPDAPDPWGQSAVHIAAAKGRSDLLLTLLDGGGRADMPDAKGRLPAPQKNSDRAELISWLLAGAKDKPDPAALSAAIFAGERLCAMRLLAAGADCNARNGEPLFHAVCAGSAELTGELLAAGADPMAGNGRAVDAALASGRPELLEPFIAAGASRAFLDERHAVVRADPDLRYPGLTPEGWYHRLVPAGGESRPPGPSRARRLDGLRAWRDAAITRPER